MDRDEIIARRNEWLITPDDEHDGFVAGYRAATADRAAALDAMRVRVEYRVSGDDRRAVIKLGWTHFELDVYHDRKIGDRAAWGAAPRLSWPSPSSTTPAQAREFALALLVLAEIAEGWEREAAGEAASE